MTDRQRFIKELFQQLTAIDYVLLKHIDPSIEEISEASDLDILITKEGLKSMISWLHKSKIINKICFDQKSTMTQAFLFFNDHSYLQLDFLLGFYRKELNYLDEQSVFNHAITTGDAITVCSQWHLLEHLLLFNFLNFSNIPEKYIHYFEKQFPEEKSKLINFINQKYQLHFSNFSEMQVFEKGTRICLVSNLKKRKSNRGIHFLINSVKYCWDVLKSCFVHRGFTITFSGVDGAGKSTILQEVKELLEQKYRRNVVVLRHRPSLLPILSSFRYGKEKAEIQAASTLPRQGSNKSRIGSLIRFLYYYTDYFIGQFYINAKFIWRGYIVLYDRYYFDFIADAKRSNILLDQSIPKFLYRFVHHPKLNLFLYAKPETILKRKQELDNQSIIDLTASYKSLFEKLNVKKGNEKYIPIENVNKNATLKTIIDQYEILA